MKGNDETFQHINGYNAFLHVTTWIPAPLVQYDQMISISMTIAPHPVLGESAIVGFLFQSKRTSYNIPFIFAFLAASLPV